MFKSWFLGDQCWHWQHHELWPLDIRLWEQTAAVCWWTLGLEHEEEGAEVQRQGQIPQEHDHAVEEIPMEHCPSVRAFVAIHHLRKFYQINWKCLFKNLLTNLACLNWKKKLHCCLRLGLKKLLFGLIFTLAVMLTITSISHLIMGGTKALKKLCQLHFRPN